MSSDEANTKPSNVVQWTKHKKMTDLPDNPVTADEKIRDWYVTYIEDALDCVRGSVIDDLIHFGVFPSANKEESDRLDKLTGMLSENLRAILCTKYGIDHVFHQIADALMTIDEDGDVLLNRGITLKIHTENAESK